MYTWCPTPDRSILPGESLDLGRTEATIYIEGIWHHDYSDEPVLLFSELDESRYEIRKVHVFRDGRVVWASEQHDPDFLSELPVPSVDEINTDPHSDSTVREVPSYVFESIWNWVQIKRQPSY